MLTGRQLRIKEGIAAQYGELVHEGQHLEPVCRDLEAFLASSQAAGERRGASAAASRGALRRGGGLAVLAPRGVARGLRRERRRMDRRRRARLRAPRGAPRGAARPGRRQSAGSTAARSRSGRNEGRRRMKTIVLDKIASVTKSVGLKREVRLTNGDPVRGGDRHRGARAHRQEHLQPDRAALRAHGAGQARRHRRRLPRPSARPLRLLREASGAPRPGRRRPPAQSRRRAGDLRLGESGPREAVRVRSARRGAHLSGARRAHRAPGADRWRAAAGGAGARLEGHSGRRHGRQLHELRQDRRRLRPGARVRPPGTARRRAQGDRRLPAARHPGARGCRRARHGDLHRPRRGLDHGEELGAGDAHAARPSSPRRRSTRRIAPT